jgi:WD40 repeat protein/serine/threonine protein kinase
LERVESLFHQAADLAPEQQTAFLDAHCAGDPALRAAVETLLGHDATAHTDHRLLSPLARPADNDLHDQPTMIRGPQDPGAPTTPAGVAVTGYDILGEVGRGGMGVVYKARQLALGRLVALKMLLSVTPPTTTTWARFRTEAEALARLQHANIVQIYDVGDAQGHPYFAMEYVPGPSLDRMLDGKPQSAKDAAGLVEVLARAMHAVHQCGIIHRDLKPANILLFSREPSEKEDAAHKKRAASSFSEGSRLNAYVPKISDFGLAKPLQDAAGLTIPGVIMGTPGYMAPEQADGVVVGPPADIYGLGAILYEMLTGRPPFAGPTALATLEQVRKRPPVSPDQLQPGLPRDLTTICLKCLEKDPRRRYRSALALAEDLRRFQAGEPVRARPVGPLGRLGRWCRRQPIVASLLATSAVLALGLIVTMGIYNTKLENALAGVEREAEKNRELLGRLEVETGMRDAEEGDAFMALLWFTEALQNEKEVQRQRSHRLRLASVWRQCPRLTQVRVIEDPVLAAAWNGNSCLLALAGAEQRVRTLDVVTGMPAGAELPHAPVRLAAFSPDGAYLATVGADGTVRVWEPRTGRARTEPLPQGGPVSQVALSENGTVLLARRADGRVQLWNGATGKRIELTGIGDGKATVAAISPDGRRLALATEGDHTVRIWDVASGKARGQSMPHPTTVTRLALSAKGDRIVTASADQRAWVWRIDSGSLAFAPWRHEGIVEQVHFSPDGRLVVSAGSDNRVRVRDAETGLERTPWLSHNGSVVEALCRGDGRQLVTVGQDGSARLWDLDAAGGPGEIIAGEATAAGPEEIPSADGHWLLVRTASDTVQVLDASTRTPRGPPLRHNSAVMHAAFHPQRLQVATASDDNTARLWDVVTGQPALPPLRHQGTVRYLSFNADGSQLITAGDDRTARVWDTATGEPLTAPLRHPREVVRASFAADGGSATTVTGDGVTRRWDLTPDDRPLATLRWQAQVLSGRRIDARGRPLALEGADLQATWQRGTGDAGGDGS